MKKFYVVALFTIISVSLLSQEKNDILIGGSFTFYTGDAIDPWN